MSAKCGTKNCRPAVYRFSLFSLLLMFLLVLGACKNSSHLPPIEQLDQPPGIKLNYHTVSRSDTLYSIAWRYSMDYRELASINNIDSPYVIRVGQKINLADGVSSSTRNSYVSTASSGVEVTAIPDDGGAITEVGAVTEVGAETAVSAVPAVNSERPVAPASVKQNVEPVVKPDIRATVSGSGPWQWPARGHISSRFSATDPARKGIDIEGKLGDSVVAARSGSVVYAGSGLAGYGELIIIKHDEQFLSAYGHNSRLLVKEGDTVNAGQKVAEVGASGTDSNKLHFEIRRDGKPVDPSLYLPK